MSWDSIFAREDRGREVGINISLKLVRRTAGKVGHSRVFFFETLDTQPYDGTSCQREGLHLLFFDPVPLYLFCLWYDLNRIKIGKLETE